MKVLEVIPCAGEYVKTDEPYPNDYIRNGSDCWQVRMGDSWEYLYDTKELEAAYQTAKNVLTSEA